MHRIFTRLHLAVLESWPLFWHYLISETRISSLEIGSIGAFFSLRNPRWWVIAVVQVVVKLPATFSLLHHCLLKREWRLLAKQSLAFHVWVTCYRHLYPFTHVLWCNYLVRLYLASWHCTLTQNSLKSMVSIIFTCLKLRLVGFSLLIEL